ncbi:hypothetical protein M501DRAFT_998342 [Patellaria atrata CBS 101060]|uniref:Uncharacterized protein n=1 Tax=Patellaria atrata CBS 101060 TaxID=1346257 RepID=A0A9P4VU28_9PEZI|nr:hypothetical protein M501DRAFT_998342 [Patellaria atrata CBS 101060]
MDERVITQKELTKTRRFGRFTPAYKLDAKTVVKTDDVVRFAEAEAMKLVREKTSIPVPEVYNVYTDPDTGHPGIVMEFVEGDCLADAWKDFDDNQKAAVIEQFRDFFYLYWICRRHSLRRSAFTDNLGGYGPYKDEASFTKGIATTINGSRNGGYINTVCDIVVNTLKGHQIVLTHGDFSPRNIIVRGSKVVPV